MPPILTQILESIAEVLSLPIRLIEEANLFFHSHFGLYGQLAFDLVLLYLLFLVAYKITRAVFDTALYVVIPSVILSLVSSLFLPYAFGYILPVCVAALIVVNIFRS
jgi:hypothetical protein